MGRRWQCVSHWSMNTGHCGGNATMTTEVWPEAAGQGRTKRTRARARPPEPLL